MKRIEAHDQIGVLMMIKDDLPAETGPLGAQAPRAFCFGQITARRQPHAAVSRSSFQERQGYRSMPTLS